MVHGFYTKFSNKHPDDLDEHFHIERIDINRHRRPTVILVNGKRRPTTYLFRLVFKEDDEPGQGSASGRVLAYSTASTGGRNVLTDFDCLQFGPNVSISPANLHIVLPHLRMGRLGLPILDHLSYGDTGVQPIHSAPTEPCLPLVTSIVGHEATGS